MGEIANMMLDGTLCQGCGVYLGDDGLGFPTFCSSCRREQRENSPAEKFPQPTNPAKVACQTCGRHVKVGGLADHVRDKHSGS